MAGQRHDPRVRQPQFPHDLLREHHTLRRVLLHVPRVAAQRLDLHVRLRRRCGDLPREGRVRGVELRGVGAAQVDQQACLARDRDGRIGQDQQLTTRCDHVVFQRDPARRRNQQGRTQQRILAVLDQRGAGVGLLAGDQEFILARTPRGLHQADGLPVLLHGLALLDVDLHVRRRLGNALGSTLAQGVERVPHGHTVDVLDGQCGFQLEFARVHQTAHHGRLEPAAFLVEPVHDAQVVRQLLLPRRCRSVQFRAHARPGEHTVGAVEPAGPGLGVKVRSDQHVGGAGVQFEGAELVTDLVVVHRGTARRQPAGEPLPVQTVRGRGGLAFDPAGVQPAIAGHELKIMQERLMQCGHELSRDRNQLRSSYA